MLPTTQPISIVSELDKQEIKQRKNIETLGKKLRMQFSIKGVKNWNDIYSHTGYSVAYIQSQPHLMLRLTDSVSFQDINDWIEMLTHQHEETFKKKRSDYIGKEMKDKIATIVNSSNEPRQTYGEKQNEEWQKSVSETSQASNSLSSSIIREPNDRTSDTEVRESVQTASSKEEKGWYIEKNNYGLIPSANESVKPYYFQKKAAAEALDKVLGLQTYKYQDYKSVSLALANASVKKNPLPAVLIIAGPGSGKTFIVGLIDRRLKDINWHIGKTWGMTNYLLVTRNSVVEQTKRVCQKYFNIQHPVDTEVINIDSLRARAGQLWVENKSIIVSGEEQEVWNWKSMINPCVLMLDECQGAKNESSKQHKIIVAFSKIQSPTIQIFYSATPFIRVADAKAFAIATKKDISHITGITGSILTEETWPTYASTIAGTDGKSGDPYEYNEAAIERLMDDLENYIVRVKGVRWQFNARNSVEIIDFEPPSEDNDFFDAAKYYQDAWTRYLTRKAKLEEEVCSNPRFRAMVELAMFLAAAEYSKCYVIAKRLYNDVQNGYAAVAAVKQKATIIKVVKILHEKYGVSRDKISLIWGGGQTQLTAKQKIKAKILENKELFADAGITLEDMNLDEVESRIIEDLPVHLRLGNQTKEERQKEIDRFQSGRSLYAIFTFKAGGVGLSLHHTDEQTNYKCRRQSNGFAILEDIPNVPTRPRKGTISTTWSPIDMVQGCGRLPRLTSLSDSPQSLLFYRGTVEEQQAFVVTHRLKCLSKVVKSNSEQWTSMITNYENAKDIARDLVENSKLTEDTEQELTEAMTMAEEKEEE